MTSRLVPHLFIGPAMLLLVAFGVLPIAVAALVSFTDMSLAGLARWSMVPPPDGRTWWPMRRAALARHRGTRRQLSMPRHAVDDDLMLAFAGEADLYVATENEISQ